jgi:acetyl/propionyl-CoA carboxylase alpha subunit
MKEYSVVAGNERVEVALERTDNGIEAKIGDRSYSIEVTRVKPELYWLNWNGKSIEVSVLTSGQSYSVSIGGHRIEVEILDPRQKLRRSMHRDDSEVSEIRAPMPGKIVRLLSSQGENVETQQGLVVMEAMKMQNEIRSNRSGRVIKLAVAEGETVGSGDLIAIVGT